MFIIEFGEEIINVFFKYLTEYNTPRTRPIIEMIVLAPIMPVRLIIPGKIVNPKARSIRLSRIGAAKPATIKWRNPIQTLELVSRFSIEANLKNYF